MDRDATGTTRRVPPGRSRPGRRDRPPPRARHQPPAAALRRTPVVAGLAYDQLRLEDHVPVLVPPPLAGLLEQQLSGGTAHAAARAADPTLPLGAVQIGRWGGDAHVGVGRVARSLDP